MTIMPLAADANQLATPADIDPDPRHFHVGVIYTMLNLLSSYKKPPRGGLLPWRFGYALLWPSCP